MVKDTEMDREASWDKYTVYFNSGSRVSFEGGKGDWSEIVMKNGAVPATVIPVRIKTYVADNYSQSMVNRLSTMKEGYKVGLTNGLTLYFDKGGQIQETGQVTVIRFRIRGRLTCLSRFTPQRARPARGESFSAAPATAAAAPPEAHIRRNPARQTIVLRHKRREFPEKSVYLRGRIQKSPAHEPRSCTRFFRPPFCCPSFRPPPSRPIPSRNRFCVTRRRRLHVHTDKDTYVAGDTIWLRARCVDAASHRPVAASRYVYAELRDESGALVRRIKILRRDSLYAGYLPVPTDAPDGDYTFSAYTRFMRNQGADYFFRKPLRIAAYRGAAGEVPKPRPRPATGDFAVTFHPEGGYLVPGRSCRVAFKALTDAGRSTAVEAVLRDDRGTTLDTVRTRRAGMGSFRMVPEAGRTYHAVCRTPSGAEKRFDLPVPNAAACVLQLEERDGFIAVNVLTAGSLPARLRLVVHCRGNRCYDGGWEPGLLFRSSDLPAGVVQWLLLDAAGNALSERLLFNEGADGVHVSLRAENPSPRRRERADFSVRLTDSAEPPARGVLGFGDGPQRRARPRLGRHPHDAAAHLRPAGDMSNAPGVISGATIPKPVRRSTN